MHRRCALILALAGLLGCASDRYSYAPVRTTGADIAGAPAAVYAIPPESPHGDVRLATFGIASLRPQGLEGATQHAVHVALVVSNRSDEPWSVEGSDQRLALAGRDARDLSTPTTEDMTSLPRLDVPARSTRRIDLYFPLPVGLATARKVPEFEVIWTVRAGSRVVTERTPFERFLVQARTPVDVELIEPDAVPSSEPLPGTEPPDRHPGSIPTP